MLVFLLLAQVAIVVSVSTWYVFAVRNLAKVELAHRAELRARMAELVERYGDRVKETESYQYWLNNIENSN